MESEIDAVLKKWAERNTASGNRLDSIADRIRTEVARTRLDSEPCVRVVVPFLWKLAYAGMGAVLSIAILLVASHLSVGPEAPTFCGKSAGKFFPISERQVQNVAQLFSEMEHLFARRLQWIVLYNGEMGIGVESEQKNAIHETPPAFVKLTVLSRKDGDPGWQPAWNVDVIVRGEEIVEVAPDSKTGDKITLWVCPLVDGKIAVDTTLSIVAPVELTSRIDTVVRQGEPREVFSVRSGDTRYCVVQTVQMLPTSSVSLREKKS